jgi:hypothetical protein
MNGRRIAMAGLELTVGVLVVAASGTDPTAPVVAVTTASGHEKQPVAVSVRPTGLSELAGRRPQRDIDPDHPSVRAYNREHRLLAQLPLTYRGVTFTVGGRKDDRVLIVALPNGLDEHAARRAYARLLRESHDRGTAYELSLATPTPEPTS